MNIKVSIHVLFAALASAALLVSMAGSADAHTPTPTWSHKWTAGQTVTYNYSIMQDSSTVPTWLRTVMNDDFQTEWADTTTNNSNGPNFALTSSTSPNVDVYWATDNPVHQCAYWLGSADSNTQQIWIRSDPMTAGIHNWCHFGVVSGCPDEGRAAIHEIIHIGGALAHSLSSSWTDTRMHGCTSPGVCSTKTFPTNPTTTWNVRTLGPCDEAAMQLRYDLQSYSGRYADCFDDISGAGTNGLITALTASSITVCANDPATVSGRLDVATNTSYGLLSGNGLPGRSLSIDRGSTANYASTTTTGGGSTSGDNWSKTFAGASNITYSYVARFVAPGNQGLDGTSRSFTITWLSPQVAC